MNKRKTVERRLLLIPKPKRGSALPNPRALKGKKVSIITREQKRVMTKRWRKRIKKEAYKKGIGFLQAKEPSFLFSICFCEN